LFPGFKTGEIANWTTLTTQEKGGPCDPMIRPRRYATQMITTPIVKIRVQRARLWSTPKGLKR